MITFTYDGKSSTSVGMVCNTPFVLDGAEPKIKEKAIAGRNGEYKIWDGSYKNRIGTVGGYLLSQNVYEKYDDLNNWLMGSPGYKRLTISDDPEHFLMAVIDNGADAAARMKALMPFRLRWDCMPQRFLTSGEKAVIFQGSASKHISNPTKFTSKPLLKVYGTGAGTLTIGSRSVEFTRIDSFCMLNCEEGDAYKPGEDKNNTVKAKEFPELVPGDNRISWSGNITKLEVVPRWWEL